MHPLTDSMRQILILHYLADERIPGASVTHVLAKKPWSHP